MAMLLVSNRSALVSVVIPCYNTEDHIAEAIESALAQTWPQIEVIVIDDGSTDRSLEIIKRYAPRVRWDTGPNRGGCAARNRGLGLAKGDWIQFLDADDVLLPTCVERKLTAASVAPVVTCCDVELMDPAAPRPASWGHREFDLEYMLRVGSPQTAAPLHDRNTLLAIGGFREHLPRAQEFDLHLRLAILKGATFRSHGETGVVLRPRASSISRSAGFKMHVTVADVLIDNAKLLRERGELAPALADIVSQRLTTLARKLARLDQPAEAARIARAARQLSPRWYCTVYKNGVAARIARTLGFDFYEHMHALWRKLRGRNVHV